MSRPPFPPLTTDINDPPMPEAERKYHWPAGQGPDDHPGLSELGL